MKTIINLMTINLMLLSINISAESKTYDITDREFKQSFGILGELGTGLTLQLIGRDQKHNKYIENFKSGKYAENPSKDGVTKVYQRMVEQERIVQHDLKQEQSKLKEIKKELAEIKKEQMPLMRPDDRILLEKELSKEQSKLVTLRSQEPFKNPLAGNTKSVEIKDSERMIKEMQNKLATGTSSQYKLNKINKLKTDLANLKTALATLAENPAAKRKKIPGISPPMAQAYDTGLKQTYENKIALLESDIETETKNQAIAESAKKGNHRKLKKSLKVAKRDLKQELKEIKKSIASLKKAQKALKSMMIAGNPHLLEDIMRYAKESGKKIKSTPIAKAGVLLMLHAALSSGELLWNAFNPDNIRYFGGYDSLENLYNEISKQVEISDLTDKINFNMDYLGKLGEQKKNNRKPAIIE